jgi:hypothetical protein
MLYQLAQDANNGREPLGKQGARGALFRLSLDSYGYTFVAKGTVTAFKAKLKHDGSVYRHLAKVQGELILVYLGNISLAHTYFLDFKVRIPSSHAAHVMGKRAGTQRFDVSHWAGYKRRDSMRGYKATVSWGLSTTT